MNKGQKLAVLIDLTTKLLSRGSWSGETHIQKATFFLQDLTRVETDFDFILYKHGPFSFALRDSITELVADGFVEYVIREPYGPTVMPTADGKALLDRFPRTLSEYSEQLQFAADCVGKRNVGELERVATALFIIRRDKQRHDQKHATELVRLKPHISKSEARLAVRDAEGLVSRAKEKGFLR